MKDIDFDDKVQGYEDATAGRPVLYVKQEYLEGYQEGLERMVKDAEKALNTFNIKFM